MTACTWTAARCLNTPTDLRTLLRSRTRSWKPLRLWGQGSEREHGLHLACAVLVGAPHRSWTQAMSDKAQSPPNPNLCVRQPTTPSGPLNLFGVRKEKNLLT